MKYSNHQTTYIGK